MMIGEEQIGQHVGRFVFAHQCRRVPRKQLGTEGLI